MPGKKVSDFSAPATGGTFKLSDHKGKIVVLYFYLDLPLEEIATIAGASLAAVRGRLYRGIRELRADFPITEAQA